ncbi:MAG: RHS repeat-associated core domain-containing protein [Chitinophagaceae bacterium]|nr:RHS repeat-associated core domain-containing protein [Chitinophagaceae bacterium]
MINGESGFCNHLFQGQEFDNDIGLAYNRYRYYDPENGIYISQDKIGLNGSFRPYGYVSDPNILVDLFGLTPTPYEVGTYNDLKSGDETGDGLGNHHVPQKSPAKSIVPGYPQDTMSGDAPAIRLPDDEHAATIRHKMLRDQTQTRVADQKTN